MDYQNLIDRVMAAPAKPGLAPRASALVTEAAQRLGRRTPPELAGVPNLLLRPNQEEPMSGEVVGGHVVDEATPQYHALDPIVPADLARQAQQVLAPAVGLVRPPEARPGLLPLLLPLPAARIQNPLRRAPAAAVVVAAAPATR